MHSFKVPHMSPRDFQDRVEAEVRARDFDDIVSLRIRGDELSVLFEWMGRSSLKYRLVESPTGGFIATLVKERMSPVHFGFRQGFESRFEAILSAVGAELI